jgi:hypothetical protein
VQEQQATGVAKAPPLTSSSAVHNGDGSPAAEHSPPAQSPPSDDTQPASSAVGERSKGQGENFRRGSNKQTHKKPGFEARHNAQHARRGSDQRAYKGAASEARHNVQHARRGSDQRANTLRELDKLRVQVNKLLNRLLAENEAALHEKVFCHDGVQNPI